MSFVSLGKNRLKNILWAWKGHVRQLKREAYALSFAARDPRVPLPARLLISGVVAYAFSPIDLIPDFVPLLGYMDDLILVPLGIVLALRWIPPAVMIDCRARAEALVQSGKPINHAGAAAIIAIWLACASWAAVSIWRMFGGKRHH